MDNENVIRVDFQSRERIPEEELDPARDFRDKLDTLDSVQLIELRLEIAAEHKKALGKIAQGEPLTDNDRQVMKQLGIMKAFQDEAFSRTVRENYSEDK